MPARGSNSTYLSSDERQAIFTDEMLPLFRADDTDGAILVALGHVLRTTFEVAAGSSAPGAPEPSPGPPFPDPVDGRAVYDNAGILSPDAIVRAESVIDGIEARTGAEVVVYTQLTGLRRRDVRNRIARPGTHRPVGHRAGRLQRRHGDLLRHRSLAPARPGPAVRGARVRGGLPEQCGTPGHLRERHGPAAAQRRLRRCPRGGPPEGRRGGDTGARRLARMGAPVERGPGARRRADRVPRPERLGVHQLAALRQGPGLPRRPLDPRCRLRRPT